jgi:hypothetical protein
MEVVSWFIYWIDEFPRLAYDEKGEFSLGGF